MKTALPTRLALLLLPLLVVGCGSIDTRWEGNHGPYVGTRFDIDQVTHFTFESELVAALDIPLSALVDTLLLPYDLTAKEPPPRVVTSSRLPTAENAGEKH